MRGKLGDSEGNPFQKEKESVLLGLRRGKRTNGKGTPSHLRNWSGTATGTVCEEKGGRKLEKRFIFWGLRNQKALKMKKRRKREPVGRIRKRKCARVH